MAIGTLIGLPALRLSGLYLALITLMAAGALTILLRTAQFPNGGSGFFGNSSAGGASSLLPRPSIARSDVAYYRYCVIAALVMFAVAAWHVRGKPGRAWAAIRQSEASAVAAGVHTTLYKLWAFALASFMAGIAGGLLAASAGGVAIAQFPVSNSITAPRRRAPGRRLQPVGRGRGGGVHAPGARGPHLLLGLVAPRSSPSSSASG